MAEDGLSIAILNPVDHGRLDLLAAVGKDGIGGDHAQNRGLAGTERHGENWKHVVIDAETLGILGDELHPHVLGQTDSHLVTGLLDAEPEGLRAGGAAAVVFRSPHLATRHHLDRRIEDNGSGRIAVVERGGIDERLERRAGLTHRLGGTIEFRLGIGEAADHGENATRIRVHRHEAALHLRRLAKAIGALFVGQRFHEDDVARLKHTFG